MSCYITYQMPATYAGVNRAIIDFMRANEPIESLSKDSAEIIFNCVSDNISLYVNEYRQGSSAKIITLLTIVYSKALMLAKSNHSSYIFTKAHKVIAAALDSIGFAPNGAPLRRSSRK